MANLVTSCELDAAVRGQAAPVAVSRRAAYIASRGKAMFAWHHQGAQRPGHGLLLCTPAGHEQVHAHRALRHLADRIAAAGFDAVRFDYLNTGDSADLDASENTYAAWLDNVRDAIAWMRDEIGCRAISLFGLRLGATLAAQIAAEQAVDGLILWEPIVRGRGYARELKALGMMDGAPAPTNGDLEAAGFVFARPLVEEISRVDLLTVAPRCRRALVLSRDDRPADGKLLAHFHGLGIAAEQHALPGYADMLAEPHATKVPGDAIERTVGWLRASVAGDSVAFARGDASAKRGERFVRIGGTPDLAGILTEPAQPRDLPLLVIPNAGSAYRVGPGRLHVHLARRLAACGFRCLRMDMAGLGDSVSAEPERENDPYAATALRDIERTLQFAQSELGAKRAIVMGLCSGAYFAFQAAAQIGNPILVESILINPLTFFWQDGMTIENSPVREHSTLEYYKSSAWKPAKWLKLLRGETKIGIRGAFDLLLRRLFHRQGATGSGSVIGAKLGHPAVNDLPSDLRRVRQQQRRLTCFFARSDPGYSLLMSQAGQDVRQLCDAGMMSVHFIENADHTFSRRGPREAFLDAVAEHLCERYFG